MLVLFDVESSYLKRHNHTCKCREGYVLAQRRCIPVDDVGTQESEESSHNDDSICESDRDCAKIANSQCHVESSDESLKNTINELGMKN